MKISPRHLAAMLVCVLLPMICRADPQYGNIVEAIAWVFFILILAITLPIISWASGNRIIRFFSRCISVLLMLFAVVPFFTEGSSEIGFYMLLIFGYGVFSFWLAGRKRVVAQPPYPTRPEDAVRK
jgi:hypothetical protein